MKKLILFTVFLWGISAQTIWRVDNNTQNVSDFTSLQAAIDDVSVNAGDIIYVAGSVTNYGTITVNKQLKVYGPGYLLGANPNTQANKNAATFAVITFNSGSENTEIYGITAQRMVVNTDNISISRCRLTDTGQSIIIDGNSDNSTSNVIVSQSLLAGYLNFIDYCQSIIVTNNIMGYIYMGSNTNTATISNNVFTSTLSSQLFIYNSTVQNNVFNYASSNSAIYGRNNTVVNNITSGSDLVDSLANQNSVSFSDIFTLSGSGDAQYKLKAGSPAVGAGVAGTDIGAFGGTNPYILSGLPPIPSIYSATIPVYGTAAGLNVKIKAKSNNLSLIHI